MRHSRAHRGPPLLPNGARLLALALLLGPCTSFLFNFVRCDSLRARAQLAPGPQGPVATQAGQQQVTRPKPAPGAGRRLETAAASGKWTVSFHTATESVVRRGDLVGAPGAHRDATGRAAASDGAAATGRARPRTKRWLAGRSKPRVQLAQRPAKSTSTSSTTSTSTTTTTEAPGGRKLNSTDDAAGEETEGEEEQEEAGELEEADEREGQKLAMAKQAKSEQRASRVTGTARGAPGDAKKTKKKKPSEEEEEADEEADEAVEEEEEEPKTTSTTQKPSRKSTGGGGGGGGGKGARAKPEERKKGPKKERTEGRAESGPAGAGARPELGVQANKTTTATTATQQQQQHNHHHDHQHHKKKPLVLLPFIRPKNTSVCTPEAYKEFPRDLVGDKWRARGGVLIHVAVVCYMFYSLALVCERYFMPSLEEFAQRLQLSEDVAGATLMSAGSSAPELFTAILGVFVAKGDVGTGAIVGSAVFNILFVIGLCAFVSTTSAQLQWWPVMRDSVYYTLTVLVLILIIYDERITALESAAMILLYGLYIAIMAHNEQLKQVVSNFLLSYPLTAKLVGANSLQTIDGPDEVFGGGGSFYGRSQAYELAGRPGGASVRSVEDDSIFMAALLIIVKHKRLFKSTLRFQSAARYIIIKRQHRALRQQRQAELAEEVNYFGPESERAATPGGGGGGGGARSTHSASQRAKMDAYARSATVSKQKFSIVSKDDYEFWHRPPNEGENYYLWLARIPVNYVLHYTVPDCTLYPDKYIITFFVSIIWTAVFSYVMVWMVTLIGYTLGIPDSVMGVTFLAAGTSVPDCYSSLHAARNGMADMAVSNSIGSNVFDILIGLSVPWFIQSAVYPGVVATVNSRGVIYSVILLFLSLIVTIYLLNKYDWSLQPRLGLALLIAYGLFIILTSMLEFNLFGHVNPPPC